jgi:hypothetical protein
MLHTSGALLVFDHGIRLPNCSLWVVDALRARADRRHGLWPDRKHGSGAEAAQPPRTARDQDRPRPERRTASAAERHALVQ